MLKLVSKLRGRKLRVVFMCEFLMDAETLIVLTTSNKTTDIARSLEDSDEGENSKSAGVLLTQLCFLSALTYLATKATGLSISCFSESPLNHPL